MFDVHQSPTGGVAVDKEISNRDVQGTGPGFPQTAKQEMLGAD